MPSDGDGDAGAWVFSSPQVINIGGLETVPALVLPPVADAGLDQGAPARPKLAVNRLQQRDLELRAKQAIEADNDPPRLFLRGGRITRVRQDELGHPLVETIGPPELQSRMAEAADWVRTKTSDQGEIETPAAPSRGLAANLLKRDDWDLPPLRGVTGLPVLRPDGSILDEPGYDPATHLVYAPADGFQTTVPSAPTPAKVTAARGRLEELLQDFPFVDEPSRANALALLLTPVLRPAIEGPVPLALISKPQPGAGGTLLSKLPSLIADGRDPAQLPVVRGEGEWARTIAAKLAADPTVILLDNIDGPLDSETLESALTSDLFESRKISTSQILRLPQRATWVANGNGLRAAGALPRRCYLIRLDAKSGRAWMGRDFEIPALEPHVRQHRAELVAAVLTLARAWWAADRPPASTPVLGSFEGWSRVLGGVLETAGVHGFLGNLDELYGDVEHDSEWESFLLRLHAQTGGGEFTTAELRELCPQLQLEDRSLTIPKEILDRIGETAALGLVVKKRVDRRHAPSGARIERGRRDSTRKIQRWKVVIDGHRPAGSAGGSGQDHQPDPPAASSSVTG